MIWRAQVKDKTTGKIKSVKLGEQKDTQHACRAAYIKLHTFGLPSNFEIMDVRPVF